MMGKMADKVLHRTAIPLGSTAAGELCCWEALIVSNPKGQRFLFGQRKASFYEENEMHIVR